MKKILLLVLALLVTLPAFASSNVAKQIYAQKVVDRIFQSGAYDLYELRFKRTGAIPSCRSEFYLALALLTQGDKENVNLGNSILEKYLPLQDINPQSPYFGSWYYKEYLGKTDGLEWDMFNPIPVFHIVYSMKSTLTEVNRKLAMQALENVSKGLAQVWYPNHTKPQAIGHTNYHLMYCADLLLASEYCGDGLGVSLAISALENWLSWTKKNGITEFNSPTYIAVDLQALNAIELYSKNKNAVKLAGIAADLLAADGLLHFKRPKSLLGANSRSYEVLSGLGKTSRYLEKMISGELKDSPYDPSSILDIYFEHNLGDWARRLWITASKESYTFESKWAADPWAVRKTWFGNNFALGISGMAYGSQDRNLVIDRYDSSWLTSFVPVVAINDKPEELQEMGGGSGRNHIKTPVFAVAHENRALQLYDIAYNEPDFDMNRLSLVFMFPKSELVLTDSLPKPDSPFAIKTDNDLIMVRPFVSSDDATIRQHQKGDLTIIEIRLVHDLRKDLGRRFFAGLAVEVAENVYDARAVFNAWISKPFTFRTDKAFNLVKVSFDGLKIDYDTQTRKPLGLPNSTGAVFSTPWTCMDEKGLWTSDLGEIGF